MTRNQESRKLKSLLQCYSNLWICHLNYTIHIATVLDGQATFPSTESQLSKLSCSAGGDQMQCTGTWDLKDHKFAAGIVYIEYISHLLYFTGHVKGYESLWFLGEDFGFATFYPYYQQRSDSFTFLNPRTVILKQATIVV